MTDENTADDNMTGENKGTTDDRTMNDATGGNGVVDDAVDNVTDGVDEVTDDVTDTVDKAADDLTEDKASDDSTKQDR